MDKADSNTYLFEKQIIPREYQASEYGTIFDFLKINSNQFIIYGNDHDISIWDLKEGLCKAKLEGHTNSIQKMSKSSYSNLVASSSTDQTVKIWNLDNNQCQQTINVENQKTKQKITPQGLCFTDNQLIIGGCTNFVQFYDIEKDKVTFQYQFKDGDNSSALCWSTEVCFFSEEKLVLVSEYKDFHFIDIRTGTATNIVKDVHQGHVLKAVQKKINNGKHLFLFGSSDNNAYFGEIKGNQIELKLKSGLKHQSAVTNVDFLTINQSPVGIITGMFDPNVQIFNFNGDNVFNLGKAAGPILWCEEANILCTRNELKTMQIKLFDYSSIF